MRIRQAVFAARDLGAARERLEAELDLGEPFSFDGITSTPLTQPASIIVQSGASSLTIQVEPFTGECSVQ